MQHNMQHIALQVVLPSIFSGPEYSTLQYSYCFNSFWWVSFKVLNRTSKREDPGIYDPRHFLSFFLVKNNNVLVILINLKKRHWFISANGQIFSAYIWMKTGMWVFHIWSFPSSDIYQALWTYQFFFAGNKSQDYN